MTNFVSGETLIAQWRAKADSLPMSVHTEIPKKLLHRCADELAAHLHAQPPTAKETHLMDVYEALGVDWGEDVFAHIRELHRAFVSAHLTEPAASAPPAQAPTDDEEKASRVDGVPGVGHGDLPRKPQHAESQQENRMSEQVPSIGRIVHYRLSAEDASQINRRRTSGVSIATRMKTLVKAAGDGPENIYGWPEGAQAHIGNAVAEGDTFPMLITKVWGDNPSSAVNGQAYLDGNDVLWVTSACVGDGPRTFSWPVRS